MDCDSVCVSSLAFIIKEDDHFTRSWKNVQPNDPIHTHDRMPFSSAAVKSNRMNIILFFFKKEIGYDLDIISSVKWPVIGHSRDFEKKGNSSRII